MLIGELVYRGVNPDELPLRHALAYMQNRREYFETRKMIWKQAASEVFGGST